MSILAVCLRIFGDSPKSHKYVRGLGVICTLHSLTALLVRLQSRLCKSLTKESESFLPMLAFPRSLDAFVDTPALRELACLLPQHRRYQLDSRHPNLYTTFDSSSDIAN
jgi:hypothetical protein